MDPSLSDRNPVEELAEEFVERYRRGERPSVQAYADQFPQWADKIQALFPALLVMEKVRPEAPGEETTGPADGHDAAGRLLERLGDYRVLREVGRGGMGVVYEAEQESLGRHVALKVFFTTALLEPRHLQRFQREAKAAARLHHSNIVPVHGVGEQDGMHYYVMQFIQGLGLDQVLEELRRLRHARQAPASAGHSRPAAPKPGQNISAAEVAQAMLSGQFAACSSGPPRDAAACPDANARRTDILVRPGRTGMSDLRRPGNPGTGSGSAAHSSSGVHLPGQTQGAALSESGWQYWRSIARIGTQVAEALSYAASQGILHRDIKPSNLLLDTHGTVWVTDFGLAKADTDQENLTHTGDIVGTLRYMAPERFNGQADIRSDLYALGLTLYELLTLRPAFDGIDRNKLIQQVSHDEPLRPRKLNRAVPRDLETIVLKAIARDPAHRYQTGTELADDLGRFLGDLPIQARRVSRREQLWRWSHRNPGLAILTGAVAVLVLAIAIGSPVALVRLSHEQDQTLLHLTRAEKAEKDATDKLWGAYLAQAQARRWSGQPGRRFKSLAALEEAARLRPALELRNEAVACMALADLQISKTWEIPPGTAMGAFDARLERYARYDSKGNISIRRVADDQEIVHVPAFGLPMAFSPNGQFLAVRYDGPSAVHVWDLRPEKGTGPLNAKGPVPFSVLRTPSPPGPCGSTAQVFSSDSRQLAVGLADGSVRIYDLASGKQAKQLTVGAAPVSIALHPNEQKLAVSSWNRTIVEIFDIDSGKVITTLAHAGGVNGVAWHPNGKLLASTSSAGIYLWDARSGQRRALLEGHQNVVMEVAFNHGGDLLASTGWDGTTRLWDPISGKQLVSMPGSFSRFSRDDRHLAFTNNRQVGICEVAAGRECRTFYAYGEQGSGPWGVDISPQGRLLASASDDGARLWDLATGKEIAHLPIGNIRTALFHPSGDSLLTSGELGIHRWPIAADPQNGNVRIGPPQTLNKPPTNHQARASLSQDGRRLAAVVSPQEALVINLDKPAETVRIGGHPGLWDVAISPDGKWVMTGTQHGSGIKLWDARSGQLVKDLPAGHGGDGRFSQDGKWLVTSSSEGGPHTWEVGAWQPVPYSKQHGGGVYSKDGKVLAIHHFSQRLVELVDATTGQELATLPAPNQLLISGMCFSPDGSQLAVSCYNFHTIQLWDLRLIRQQLAAMHLDWDLPPCPPADPTQAAGPLKVTVVPGALAPPAPPPPSQ